VSITKTRIFFVAIAVCVLAFACAPDQGKSQDPAKIGPRGTLYKGVTTVVEEPAVLSASEAARKEVSEAMDKAGLLYSGDIVVDQDERMLVSPENVKAFAGRDYSIAETPPRIEFGIVPARPFFFADPPDGNAVGPWSNWSQAVYYPPLGKFYSSVGDHGSYDAHIYIVEYDPSNRRINLLPEVNQVLGRKTTEFSEGKIHGWLDFYDGPNLWYCTYWAKYPEPEEKDYATGYEGGHIMSINVETGDIVDYGVPMIRASWPYHRVDTRRGMMYAVGMFGEFLAWDIKEQKTRWAGYLPEGLGWWVRAIMIDEETGMVYTTNMADSDKAHRHIIRYDPFKNRFSQLTAEMPKNRVSGLGEHMRAQTPHRGPDGLFYGVTHSGELFTFDPESEEVVALGANWPGEERYTTSMDRSPGGRYVYYLPGAHGLGFKDGSPLIQYDTQTGKKKVLAFLHPFYHDKYGYTPGGTFSIRLDDTGERLFVLWNGGFVDIEEQMKKDRPDVFGQCAVMLIYIPESERIE
jgi:hypothetical protein